MEYNTKVISTVLNQYLTELRDEGDLNRSTVRELLAEPIGHPDSPLYGRIDGTNLDETWFTYINVNYRNQEFGGFGLEWDDYTAEYTPGQPIVIEEASLSE